MGKILATNIFFLGLFILLVYSWNEISIWFGALGVILLISGFFLKNDNPTTGPEDS